MSIKKSKALSYVELILVIGLIGVVSALTIVPFKRHSQRKELGHLAHKAYLTLEDVADNAILTNGPMRNWNMSSNSGFCNTYLLPNTKTSSANCSGDSPYVITKDNMKMTVAECNGNFCHVHVDVNSDLPPNKYGKDLFEFQFTKVRQDSYLIAESVRPYCKTERHLMNHNWEFSDTLWNCQIENCSTDCGY